MKRVMVILGLSLVTSQVHAGEAGAALSKCLTESVSIDDRRALARWIFSAMAVHPDTQGFVTIDAMQRDELELAGAEVFERLIAEDCTAQSREALVTEGTEGFGEAFKALGEVAMVGVVQDSQVQAAMARLGSRVDHQRILKALLSK